ncbi:uncharacterized protein LOC114716137 [Neltuma alba]|uniref:uncharacterized protein LOC114716137 n=1 Tax=Neltuma alba TaxID=207710 RepID=UPI0010A5559B|nr:uncharacterized protein LOC114716137 [Prosopis alba]
MVRTQRNPSLERPLVQDARVPLDPLQIIMDRLEQQQKTIEEMRAAQACQEQERDAAIVAAVAAALANLDRRQPEEETSAVQATEQLPRMAMLEIDPNSIQQGMTRFCKHNPPSFDGVFDVQVAEDWISRLEKIFKVLDCPTEWKAHMSTPKSEKRDQDGTSSNANRKRRRPWDNRKNKKGGKPSNSKECLTCGKSHGDRPYMAGQNVCYTCSKPRHFSRECPQNTEKARPRTQGRVLAITQEEAQKSPEMI